MPRFASYWLRPWCNAFFNVFYARTVWSQRCTKVRNGLLLNELTRLVHSFIVLIQSCNGHAIHANVNKPSDANVRRTPCHNTAFIFVTYDPQLTHGKQIGNRKQPFAQLNRSRLTFWIISIHQGLICLLSPRHGLLLMTLRQNWSLFHLKHTSFYTIIGLAARVVVLVCCSEKTLMCRKLMRVRKPLSSSRNGA